MCFLTNDVNQPKYIEETFSEVGDLSQNTTKVMQLIGIFLHFQDIVIFAFGSIKIKNVWSAANYDNIMVIRHTTDISPIAVPNFLLKGPNTHATAFRTPSTSPAPISTPAAYGLLGNKHELSVSLTPIHL